MLCCLSLQSHLFGPVYINNLPLHHLCVALLNVVIMKEPILAVSLVSLHVHIHLRSVGRLVYDLRCHRVRRQPHDRKHLSCDLIGGTQTNCPTILTGIPTSHTNTHTDPHASNKGVGVIAHDLTCATTPHESFPLFSRSHTVTSVLLLVTK